MRSGSSVSTHHHHYALNTGTSDEELLCASLMKNSREIKAYFNNSITNNTNNTPSQQSQQNQQPQQQPYDQRSSYNNNNNGFNNNNNGFNNNNNNGFNNNNGYNNNNRQQQQQDYDDNYENDEARFKPSSRWRKGERQGVNLKSNNNNNGFNNNNNQYSSRENDYFTEKPNNMIPSSPNKGQQSNRNQPSYQQQQNNNNPYSNGSYDDSPTLRYDAPQQPPPQQRPYYNNGNPHQQQAIPNVHDYFNPYQNAYPAQYSPHQVIPQPTFVHYPSYPSHPLSSPVIHHHINPPQPHIPPQQPQQYSQPPLQLNQLNQFNQIPSISPSSQTPSQVTTPRGRSDSDVVTMNEQVNIPSKRPQKITIEEEPIIHEEENPKSIAWSTNMTSPSKKKKGITPKKDTKKIPLKKSQSTRHSSVPPKFGIPYNLNRIESKIKDQIQMDKRTNPHKGNFEPVLVTSKNEETVIGDYEITPDSNNIENLNISKIDSFKPPIPKEKPIYDQEDETIPQKQDNYVVSKPPRQARFSSTPNKQEIQQPKEEVIPPPLQTKLRQPPSTNQSINTNAPNSNNNVNNNIGSNTTGSGYASQYSNRSSQQNLIPRSNSNQNVIPERVPERPRPIITPIPTEKINQERVQSLNNRMPEKPIMDIPRSDPIRQSQLQQQIPQKQQPQPQQQPAQRQSQQPPIVKTPVRNVPSKRLEELLYQKSKPIESPRAENHGGSVLSIVENFMLDPNMKDFY